MVEIAINLAVLTFNNGIQGLTPLLHHLGTGQSSLTSNFLAIRDTTRLKRAEHKEEVVAKRRRKLQRGQKRAAEESQIQQEGVFYASGGF